MVFRGALNILESVIQINKGEDLPNREIVDVLTQNVLDKLSAVIKESNAGKKHASPPGPKIRSLQEELQKILLYKTIYAEELTAMTIKLKRNETESAAEGDETEERKETLREGGEAEDTPNQEDLSSEQAREGVTTLILDAERILKIFDRKFPSEGTYVCMLSRYSELIPFDSQWWRIAP